MRILNKKQKTAIKKWFDKNWTGSGSLYTIDQMPVEMQEQVQAMNDHETFWSNADRFIGDLASENVHRKKNPWD